jgi:hypothetical protein
MQFVQRPGGVWHLIDETAPPEECLVAEVRGPVEVLALKGLCEARLASAAPPEPFGFHHEGHEYRVTPYADRGDKLSLRIDGSNGSLSRVETEFRHETEDPPDHPQAPP